jgi:POT family proton-dependent oligopeptide transporter
MSETPTGPTNVPTTHPKGFFFIFWGEFAERCCYYGMRAILPLYLTKILLFEDTQANEIYAYFKAACYLLPLLGGFLADRYFGKYWTIVGFSVFYVIGLFILAVPHQTALLIALALMALGSGVIKPNISTLMGLTYDQKRPGQLRLRSAAFQWFYFSVNVGALVSLFALPKIRDAVANRSENPTLGYQTAFTVAAILMVIALTIFAIGKKHYAVEVIERRPSTPEERRQKWQTLSTLFGIFALMSFFWMAYEQNDSLWVFFARDNMTIDAEQKQAPLNLGFTSMQFSPDGYQFINALCVLLFIPIINMGFAKADPQGTRIRPTHKMFAGFIITAAASGVMALAARSAGGTGTVSPWWLVIAYVVLTLGEVLVYGTGLELSFAAAPATMKSFVTACFLLTNTFGNLLASQYGKFFNRDLTVEKKGDSALVGWVRQKLLDADITYVSPHAFFLTTMGIVLAASVVFYFVGRRFNRAPTPTT